MMILTEIIEVKRTDNLTSDYIDADLRKQGLDVISWAILDVKKDVYSVNVAFVKEHNQEF